MAFFKPSDDVEPGKGREDGGGRKGVAGHIKQRPDQHVHRLGGRTKSSLNNQQFAMENHHFSWVTKWSCSIAQSLGEHHPQVIIVRPSTPNEWVDSSTRGRRAKGEFPAEKYSYSPTISPAFAGPSNEQPMTKGFWFVETSVSSSGRSSTLLIDFPVINSQEASPKNKRCSQSIQQM